jgi:hypothetical protein
MTMARTNSGSVLRTWGDIRGGTLEYGQCVVLKSGDFDVWGRTVVRRDLAVSPEGFRHLWVEE